MNREIFQGPEVAFIKSPAQNELTRSARILYSEGSNSVETARDKTPDRIIFMAEDQAEVPKLTTHNSVPPQGGEVPRGSETSSKPTPPTPEFPAGRKRATPEQIEIARILWEKENEARRRGKPLGEEEKFLIMQGIPPISGGAEAEGRPSLSESLWAKELRAAMMGEKFDEIEEIINKLDLDGQIPDGILDLIGKASVHKDLEGKKTYGYAIEYAVERIIGVPDITPRAPYELGFYSGINLAILLRSVRDEDQNIFKYLSHLRHFRYVAHEVYRTIGKSRDEYKEIVSRHVGAEGFDFLENQVAGVSTMQRLYEKALAHRASLKKGWLEERAFEEADGEVKDLLKIESEKGMEKKTVAVNRGGEEEPSSAVASRALRPWEIERAKVVGRTMAAASQRRTVYGILGDTPDDPDVLLRSFDSEYIARALGGLKPIGARFMRGTPISAAYLDRVLENKKKIAAREGQHYGEKLSLGKNEKGRNRSLYGQTEDAIIYLHTGVADPKSSVWRANIMFLKQKEYANGPKVGEDGRRLTIGDYLDREWNASGKNPEDFSRRVKDEVVRQRLFLGTLVRNKNLSNEVKTEVWKNIAELLPSRMAAFFPAKRDIMEEFISNEKYGKNYQKLSDEEKKKIEQNITDKTQEFERSWEEGLRLKLYLAEEQRVTEDADKIKSGEVPTKKLEDYFEENGITEQRDKDMRDKDMISALTHYGKLKAPALATMIFPFTPFLDDVPRTGWGKASQADLYRLLVSDQDAFMEANSEHVGVVANPAAPWKETLERYHKMETALSSPMGHPYAQKFMEAPVVSMLEMRTQNRWAAWFGLAMKLARIPRSQIEQYNLDSHVSDDEEELRAETEALSSLGIISSDTSDRDKEGNTQLDRVRNEVKARRRDIIGRFLRILLMLLPVEMVVEMFKTLMPPEVIKSLQ